MLKVFTEGRVRTRDIGGTAHTMDFAEAIQQNFIFGTPGADTQLEANRQAFFTDFVTRPQFVSTYAMTLTPAQYVDALYANAGIVPTTAQRQAAIDEFAAAANTADQAARSRALRRVAENTAFSQAEFNHRLNDGQT